MKRCMIAGVLVIAAHWAIAVWHLFMVAKVVPAPDNNVSWVAIGLLSVVHACIAVVSWRALAEISGLILIVFLFAALSSGIYEHFLNAGPNNIFRVASNQWTVPFQISVILLVILEVVGWLVGILRLSMNKVTIRHQELQR